MIRFHWYTIKDMYEYSQEHEDLTFHFFHLVLFFQFHKLKPAEKNNATNAIDNKFLQTPKN